MKSSSPSTIVSVLLQAALLLLASISCSGAKHGWRPSHLPSPQRDLRKVCGRNGINSAVCTPDRLLSRHDADRLDGLINFIAEGKNGFELAECGSRVEGYKIAVAIVKKMHPRFERFASNKERAKLFAKGLHDSWGVGDAACQNGVVIFVSAKDRVMHISTGRGTKLLLTGDRVDHILRQIQPLMRRKLYSRALLGAVERIGFVLSNKSPEDFNHESTTAHILIVLIVVAYFLYTCFRGMVEERKRREKYRRCCEALRRIDEDNERASNNNYQSSTCPICLEEFEPATADVEPDSAKPVPSGTGNTTDSSEIKNDRERTSLLSKKKKTSWIRRTFAKQKKILPCGHHFHTDCVKQWSTSGNGTNRQNCPVCRRPIDSENEELSREMNEFQVERQFRIRRTHDIYPEYVSYSLMNLLVRDRNARLTTNAEFAIFAARLMEQSQRAGAEGSSYYFGDGRSRRGGGGGSSW